MNAKTMSYKAAAIELLRRSGEPMTAKELTAQAIEEGLIAPEGKTPEATMAAQLYVDINKNPKTPFKKVGKGKFSLLQQTESASSAQLIIEKQNDIVQADLKKRLHAMDAYQFEYMIGDLLKELGYENVVVTKSSGDKGIDIMAELTLEGITSVKTVVQVKRFKAGNNIPGKIVTQLRGSAAVDQRGLIITTSDFTKDAIAEAKAPSKMPIALVNGEKLLTLLIKHQVGVKVENVALLAVDTEYFENVEPNKGKGDNAGKNRTIWPMPGGTTSYIETLFKFLGAVAQGVNTKSTLVAWFRKNFDTVKSENTASGYINVPRSMRLIEMTEGKFSLTPAGEQVLATRDLGLLYDAIAANILGIDEIIELLETAGEPQTEESILEFLKGNLDIAWSTYAQVSFRLYWLMDLGKITKTEDGWTLA